MKVHDIETAHGLVCVYYDRHQRVWKAYFGRFVGYGMNKAESIGNLIDISKGDEMKTLEAALAEETCRVGCVYPDHEESYYISSNLRDSERVECTNGFYYREVED